MSDPFSEANVAIVVAFKKEAQALLERAGSVQKAHIQGFVVYGAKYCERNIIVVVSGTGFKNAQVATALALKKSNSLQKVINIGFVGGLTDFYDLSEVVQVGTVLKGDGELVEASLSIVQSLPIVKLVCVKSSVLTVEARNNLVRACDAECVDMESQGFLEALKTFLGQVSLLKVISDFADEKSRDLILGESQVYSRRLEQALREVYFS